MDRLVVGDPHCTHKSLDRIQQLFDIVENTGLPTDWTGDLLDTKEVIRGKCLNAFFEYFKRSKLEHRIVVGNHDWFNLDCEDHSLRTLSSLPNITIIDKPTVIGEIAYIPYIHDLNQLREAIAQVKTKVLIAHLDVMDFDYGNGQLCEKGLKLEELKHIPMVISGHFHKYQQKGNLIYIGSPFSHSFGESDQIKYLGKLIESGGFQAFQCPLPFHTTFKYDCFKSSIEDLQNFVGQNLNNFLRVELIGNQTQISTFPRDLFKNINIKWVPRPIEVETSQITIQEGLDNSQQFVMWAKDIKKLDQSTIDLGLSILGSLNAK